MENAVSNLEFGWVENLGWIMLSRHFKIGGGGGGGGGWKIWGGKSYLESPIWVGGKFGVDNAVSNLEFGRWRIWGGKMLSRIF